MFIVCLFDFYKKYWFSLIFFFLIFLCKVFGSFLLFCDFVVWDKNGDGYVDLEEFFFVVYFYVKEGDLVLVF